MRALIILVLGSSVALCAPLDESEGGHYQSDDSGQYVPTAEGKYISDNSGQYIPDDSGRYRDDGTGRYRDDPTGRYFNRAQYYKQQSFKNPIGKQSTFRGDFSRSRPSPNLSSFISSQSSSAGSTANIPAFSPNLVEAGNFDFGTSEGATASSISDRSNYKSLSNSFGQPSSQFGPSNANSFGNVAAAATLSAVRHQAVRPFSGGAGRRYQSTSAGGATGQYRGGDDSRWRILKQSGDVAEDGYHWDFETENGIIADETGQLANRGTDKEAMRAQGQYTYTGPDNVIYSVTYTADENGYRAEGAHLPTPPPTPEAILKALEFQRQAGTL